MLTEKEINRISEHVDTQLALIEAVSLMSCYLEMPAKDEISEEYYREKFQAFVNKQNSKL